MFARVGIFQGAPEHLDHAIRRGLEQRLPALQRLPGFAGLYVLADRQTGKTISISLWETEAALRRASDASRRSWVAAGLAATGRTEQAVAGYEVVLSPDSHCRAHSPPHRRGPGRVDLQLTDTEDALMLSRRTHGELELPHQHQAQLRREATRWHLARRAATTTGHRTARPDRLRAALTLGAILVGVAVSVSQTARR